MRRRPDIDLSDAAVLDRLQDLVGIPFLKGGRTPAGADCMGATLMGLDLGFGIESEDPWLEIEQRWAAGHREIGDLFPRGWQRIDSQARPGDVLTILENKVPSHIALMAPLGMTLSSQERTGCMFVRFSFWEPRLHSVWRAQV